MTRACGYAYTKDGAEKKKHTGKTDARPIYLLGRSMAQDREQSHVGLGGRLAGVTTVPTSIGEWLSQNAEDPDKVMVDFDLSNAHNSVDRAGFRPRAAISRVVQMVGLQIPVG